MATRTEASLKERVLDAARHLLAKEGYGGLSMRKLARTVGCKAPSIYHHFENKDDIVHTLIGEGYDRQRRRLEEAAAPFVNPLSRIGARAYADFALENPAYYRIMYLLRTDEMARYPKERFRRTLRSLRCTTADLEEAAERGLLTPDADPYVRVTAGAAMLHGVVALILTERLDTRLDREAVVEHVIQRTLDPHPPGA